MRAAAPIAARARGVSFWYPDSPAAALHDIDIEVRESELLLLCGPSGGGKSTLLRLFQGIVPQRTGGDLAGTVETLGHDATTVPPHALAAAGATLVFQNPIEGFVADRVADEVAFGPENLGLPRDEIAMRVRESLAAVGLACARGRRCAELSGGEQQRIALAAALALRPRLLLLDEPTAHLDERSGLAILALVDRVRRETGIAVVMAEHRVGPAARIADRVGVLVGGSLRAIGTARDVFADGSLVAAGVPVPRATQVALRLALPGTLPLDPSELAALLRDRAASSDSSAKPGPPASEPVIRFVGVRYGYPGAANEALAGVDLTVRRGERVALVGPSGAGKSTLARLALGLRRPSAGHLTVFGESGATTATLARRVGLVVQNPVHQLLTERVDDEIRLGLRDLPPGERQDRAAEAISRFALESLRARHPLSLSEGERRRVALAAVISRRPELLVLDEPTLAQDEVQRLALAALVRELAAGGTTVLVISHDREFVNDACERVVVMRDGQVRGDLALGADGAAVAALAAADVPLADVPATVAELAAVGRAVAARSVDELVAAYR